jgi:hypothetical protein
LAQRTQATLLLGFLLLGVLLLLATPLRAAEPTPIACPTGTTVFVTGRAPAFEPLLLFLDGRAVGGGVADGSGVYRLPLRAQERPGRYPIEVRLRASPGVVVGSFTCFVDVPLGEVPSATASPARAATRPATVTVAATPRLTPSPRVTAGTPTPTPTGPTATPTSTGTAGPSPTPTRTPRPGEPTPTTTLTATPRRSDIRIFGVTLINPLFPNESREYLQILNDGGQSTNLSGWRIVNASRPDGSRPALQPFVFPDYTLRPDTTAVLYSEIGENDLDFGDFFWNQSQTVWRAGDRAELRDAQNNLVHSYVVVGR